MGKYQCICSNIVSDVCEPDNNLGSLHNSWDEDNRNYGHGRDVWECHKCGALALEDFDNPRQLRFYIPEDRKVGNLFIARQ